MPLARLLLASALLLPAAAAGWKLPWRKAPDPRVETSVWKQPEGLDLSGQRIALYPFAADTRVKPAPPSLAEPLAHSLTAELETGDVAVAGGWPWDDLPEQEKAALAEEDKLALLVETAREGEFDAAVVGRIEKFYRRAAGGLYAEVSVLLLSIGDEDGDSAAEPLALWNGRKTFEWRGYTPADACFAVIARELAREWAPPQKQDAGPSSDELSTTPAGAPRSARPRAPSQRPPDPSPGSDRGRRSSAEKP